MHTHKAALLTGSTSGISLAIASEQASCGMHIMMNGCGDAAEGPAPMKFNQWGRIVKIASAHVLLTSPCKPACVAAARGMAGLTKTVALKMVDAGITANAACPGCVLTPLAEKQIPDTAKARGIAEKQVKLDVLPAAQTTSRFVTADAVARLVAFLCRNAATSIIGIVMPIHGGCAAHWTGAPA